MNIRRVRANLVMGLKEFYRNKATMFFVLLFRRLGLGATLGYLVAGALVGPQVFGLAGGGEEIVEGADRTVDRSVGGKPPDPRGSGRSAQRFPRGPGEQLVTDEERPCPRVREDELDLRRGRVCRNRDVRDSHRQAREIEERELRGVRPEHGDRGDVVLFLVREKRPPDLDDPGLRFAPGDASFAAPGSQEEQRLISLRPRAREEDVADGVVRDQHGLQQEIRPVDREGRRGEREADLSLGRRFQDPVQKRSRGVNAAGRILVGVLACSPQRGERLPRIPEESRRVGTVAAAGLGLLQSGQRVLDARKEIRMDRDPARALATGLASHGGFRHRLLPKRTCSEPAAT